MTVISSDIGWVIRIPLEESSAPTVKSGQNHQARYLFPPSSLPNSLPSVPSSLAQLTQHDISPHTAPYQTFGRPSQQVWPKSPSTIILRQPAAYQAVGRPSRQVWHNTPSTISLPIHPPTKQSSAPPVKSGPTNPARKLYPTQLPTKHSAVRPNKSGPNHPAR